MLTMQCLDRGCLGLEQHISASTMLHLDLRLRWPGLNSVSSIVCLGLCFAYIPANRSVQGILRLLLICNKHPSNGLNNYSRYTQ